MSETTTAAAPDAALLRACASCGASILKRAEICPKCGVRQRTPVSKTALLLLTFFLGGLGAHSSISESTGRVCCTCCSSGPTSRP